MTLAATRTASVTTPPAAAGTHYGYTHQELLHQRSPNPDPDPNPDEELLHQRLLYTLWPHSLRLAYTDQELLHQRQLHTLQDARALQRGLHSARVEAVPLLRQGTLPYHCVLLLPTTGYQLLSYLPPRSIPTTYYRY